MAETVEEIAIGIARAFAVAGSRDKLALVIAEALRSERSRTEEAVREAREQERADIVAGLREHAEMHNRIALERPLENGRLDDIAREHRMIAVRTSQNSDWIERGDHLPRALPRSASYPRET